jgi:hypothetical protein
LTLVALPVTVARAAWLFAGYNTKDPPRAALRSLVETTASCGLRDRRPLRPRNGVYMSIAVRIVDQILGVDPPLRRELRLVSERTTVRELMKRRIDEEVAALNAGREDLQPLVVPTEQESRLNKTKPAGRTVDAGKQLATAVAAFERTRIVVIIDGRQVKELDQPITVSPDSEIRFVKLVPLMGG